jgi:hypothetical protein
MCMHVKYVCDWWLPETASYACIPRSCVGMVIGMAPLLVGAKEAVRDDSGVYTILSICYLLVRWPTTHHALAFELLLSMR